MYDVPLKIDFAVGIDNGLSGAIAVVPADLKSLAVKATPVMPGRTRLTFLPKSMRTGVALQRVAVKNEKKLKSQNKQVQGTCYDLARMSKLFDNLRHRAGPDAVIVAVSETQMIRGSGKFTNLDTMRSNQDGQTRWQIASEAGDALFIEVAAATWKADMSLTVKNGEDPKAKSLKLYRQLFPRGAELTHDQAEAVLLAVWLHRFYQPSWIKF